MYREPDFCFQFEPEEDIRQNPRVLYVKPGNEWADMEKAVRMRICKR